MHCFATEFDQDLARRHAPDLVDGAGQNRQRAFIESTHPIILKRERRSAELLRLPLERRRQSGKQGNGERNKGGAMKRTRRLQSKAK